MCNKTRHISAFCIFIILIIFIFFTSFKSKLFPCVVYDIINLGFPVNNSVKQTEKKYNESLYNKNIFLEIFGEFSNIIGTRELNGVLKLNNGMLYKPIDNVYNIEHKTSYIRNIANSINGDFMFVALPDLLSNNSNLLPLGKEYSFSFDSFISELQKQNINIKDFRQIQTNQPLSYKFFNTDHHWKPLFAFDAFVEICRVVQKEYGTEINKKFTSIENYSIKNYNDIFLGSSGKRTGRMYAGLDDFDLIIPKFETSFNTHYLNTNETKTGSYNDILIREDYLNKNYYELNTYRTYLGEENPQIALKNNDNKAYEKRILLIHDSYAMPLICFMSCAFSEVYTIDLRYQSNGFNTINYINNIQPDLVIMLYSPTGISDNKNFIY